MRTKLIEEYKAVTERMIDLQTADIKGMAVHVECRYSQLNRKNLRNMSENRKIRSMLQEEFFINDSGNLASEFYSRNYFTNLYWITTGEKTMAIHEIFGGTVEAEDIYFMYGQVRQPDTVTDEHFKAAKAFMLGKLINALDNERLQEETQKNKRLLKYIEEAHEKQIKLPL